MANISKVELNGTTYNINTSGSIPESEKGAANGVASLDSSGKVPSSQLPSYVDDVLEYSAKSSFPATGETGKIYVDTTTNKTYRWSGSAYVEISESLALGETSSTAYRGDRGKAAYDHSRITNGNPHGTTGANTNLTGYSKGSSKDAVAATDTVNAAIAKHENRINANQTNILYNLNMGVKNKIPYRTSPHAVSDTGITVSIDDDNTYKITGTKTISDSYIELDDIISSELAGDHVASISVSGTGNCQIAAYGYNGSTWTLMLTTSTAQGFSVGSYTIIKFRIRFTGSINSSYNAIVKPMVCKMEAWNQSHDWQPPALPNYDLTRLESEDRASLAEVVDSGAKNIIDVNNYSNLDNVTISNGVFTTQGDTLTTLRFDVYLRNGSTQLLKVVNAQVISSNGVYYWEFVAPTNTNNVLIGHNGGTYNGRATINLTNLVAGQRYVIQVNVTQCQNASGAFKWQDVMVCTKAAFGVSPKFVPFGNDPFYQVPINHNMIYRGRNLGATLTDAQHTALSSGNFTDIYLGDYWTKTVTIPTGTYTGGDGKEVTVPAQTNITLKAVIADFDTFYAGDASNYATINTHHAAVIVTGFSNVVWNKTECTAGGYLNSLINKWLVGSALPQIETWFGSAKVLSHQKLLTNGITDNAASRWTWREQKISLLSENQVYGSKVWGNSKSANGGYEPGEAFKHLNIFNHINPNLLFGDKYIWLRDIATAYEASMTCNGYAYVIDTANTQIVPAALILLS